MTIQKILLVDDDANIRLLAQMSLEEIGGWRVTTVSSGVEALAAVASDRPDVILLDVRMPGMDGPTTLSKLKEMDDLADIPVIFVTASVQKDEVGHYLSLGVAGLINKPFDPMLLPDQIMALCPGKAP